MRRFLFFLIVASSLVSHGQAPGYMGKKTTIGYGFNINPAITAALADYGTSIVNTQHEFFIEQVLGKRFSLGASFKLYKSTYNNTGQVDMKSEYYNAGYISFSTYQIAGYGTSPYLADPQGQIKIKARNFALYTKLFRRKYVAPWGKYILLGATLNVRTASYNPNEMRVEDRIQTSSYPYTYEDITFNDFGDIKQRYLFPDMLFGMGNCRIVGKHLIIDYGWTMNVAAMAAGVVDAFDIYKPEPDEYIQRNSGMRVRGINRFNAFVKVAYLF
ncbi:hypothetical protein CNR22_09375 [Sphingobacteriaceae bacterium]|nr:hypothetical protein CNR22_09375 [Sphingobacteriaceae bacterium]